MELDVPGGEFRTRLDDWQSLHAILKRPAVRRGALVLQETPVPGTLAAMPEASDWDGPLYAPYGVLEDDGDGVLCHACGTSCRLLISHILRIHGLSAAAYREAFGLNRRTPLASHSLRAHQSQIAAPYPITLRVRCDFRVRLHL